MALPQHFMVNVKIKVKTQYLMILGLRLDHGIFSPNFPGSGNPRHQEGLPHNSTKCYSP